MSSRDKKTAQQESRRLTFRQKFWLFGVGLPVLLLIVLLALAVFLPRPLNPTEQKLVGQWIVVEPVHWSGRILEFDERYAYGSLTSKSATTTYLWEADEASMTLTEFDGREYWTRLRSKLGLSNNYELEWRIDVLNDNQLEIRRRSASIRHVRVEPSGR